METHLLLLCCCWFLQLWAVWVSRCRINQCRGWRLQEPPASQLTCLSTGESKLWSPGGIIKQAPEGPGSLWIQAQTFYRHEN